MTTVGYGGHPHTDAGRVIGIIVMVAGIGFVAVLTAAAAERLIRARQAEERGVEARLDEIIRRLDSLERRFP